MDDWRVVVPFPLGTRYFLQIVRTYAGAHSAFGEWLPWAVAPRIKQLGRDAKHWPPSSAEVKNKWSCTPRLTLYNHKRSLGSLTPSLIPSAICWPLVVAHHIFHVSGIRVNAFEPHMTALFKVWPFEGSSCSFVVTALSLTGGCRCFGNYRLHL